MISTFKQMREFIGPKIGFDESHTKVHELVNSAIELLLEKADWRRCMVRTRFCLWHNTLVAPYGVEKVVRHSVAGQSRLILDQPFEFIEGGIGDTEINSGTKMDLLDLGYFPWFYEIPQTCVMKLVAFSPIASDAGKKLQVWGFREDNQQSEGGSEMEEVTINVGLIDGVINEIADQHMSASDYREISKIIKPVTAGYVTLYAYDASEQRLWFLAKYQPAETVPSYRRYKVLNFKGSHDTSSSTGSMSMLCFVKYAFTPLTDDTDIPMIQSRQALLTAVQSLLFRERGMDNVADKSEATAIRLQEQREQHERAGQELVIEIVHGPMGLGDCQP